MEKVFIQDKETNITYYIIGVKNISSSQQATITQYPIPEGSFISDHSYKESDSLSLKVISDGFNSVVKSYWVDSAGNSGRLTYEMFKDLIQHWLKEAVQLDIQTVHHLFRSMVLNSISWIEEKSRTKFSPNLGFEEVRIAHLYTLPLSALNVKYTTEYMPEEISSGTNDGQELSETVGGKIIGVAKWLMPTTWISEIPGVKESWYGQLLERSNNASAKIINAVTGFFGNLFGGN